MTLTDKLSAYARLMRLDKPIGIYLLLWPTLWALLLAANGIPSLHILFVFIGGVVLMRSAGCVINDYADRHVDGAVARTAQRPLVSGQATAKEALWLFVGLCLLAFALVLTLNWQTILMSFAAVFVAALYPFMKRVTYLPQFVLGTAFSFGIPMAFTAIQETIPWWVWLIFLANLTWTVAYDTQYAMVDRDDDVNVGIKSTAILFGQHDRTIIGILQIITLVLLAILGNVIALSWPFYLSLVCAAAMFVYHQSLIWQRQREQCFKAFLHNHYVGLVICAGIAGHLLLSA